MALRSARQLSIIVMSLSDNAMVCMTSYAQFLILRELLVEPHERQVLRRSCASILPVAKAPRNPKRGGQNLHRVNTGADRVLETHRVNVSRRIAAKPNVERLADSAERKDGNDMKVRNDPETPEGSLRPHQGVCHPARPASLFSPRPAVYNSGP